MKEVAPKKRKTDDGAMMRKHDEPTTSNRFVAAALGIKLKKAAGAALPSKAELDRLAERHSARMRCVRSSLSAWRRLHVHTH